MNFYFSVLTVSLTLAAGSSPGAPLLADEGRGRPSQEISKRSVDQADSLTIEGHVYPLIRVGTQIWLGENLRATRDRNGEPLAWVGPGGADAEGNARGKFYPWEAARRAAPAGWRLPRVKDWQGLLCFLGGDAKAGRKLLGTGPGEFCALLAGGIDHQGRDFGRGKEAVFWTSAETSVDQALCLTIGRGGDAQLVSKPKASGFAVRLIRDDSPEFAALPPSPASRGH